MSKVPTLFYLNSLSFQILFNGSRMTISYGGLVDIFGTSGKLIFSIHNSREVILSPNHRIYKIENRNSIWKCFFECHHDEQCDFFVDVHSYCCFGDFHYTGSTPITWTDDVTLYVKKG